MNLSLRQLLAPWAGLVIAWLGARGLKLSEDQTLGLMVLLVGACANVVHALEAWLEGGSSGPLPRPSSAADRVLPKVLVLPFLLLMAGAQVGCAGSPVRSTDEGLYAAYGTYIAIEETIAEGLANGSIEKAQGEAWQAKAVAARSMLDAARVAERSSSAGAAADLSAAVSAMAALQAALNAGVAK